MIGVGSSRYLHEGKANADLHLSSVPAWNVDAGMAIELRGMVGLGSHQSHGASMK